MPATSLVPDTAGPCALAAAKFWPRRRKIAKHTQIDIYIYIYHIHNGADQDAMDERVRSAGLAHFVRRGLVSENDTSHVNLTQKHIAGQKPRMFTKM